ncbi:MAG: hypothetical protein MUF42_09420, partial [Cytophagaceae bacterium]|nr:hypothetical protein [Cytophagaceae bacterium]
IYEKLLRMPVAPSAPRSRVRILPIHRNRLSIPQGEFSSLLKLSDQIYAMITSQYFSTIASRLDNKLWKCAYWLFLYPIRY